MVDNIFGWIGIGLALLAIGSAFVGKKNNKKDGGNNNNNQQQ